MGKLSGVPLFTGLSEPVLKILSAHAHSVNFLADNTIIGEGDKGEALYIILQGYAQATRK